MKKKQSKKATTSKQTAPKAAAPAHRPADKRQLQKTYVSLPLKQSTRIDKLAAKHKVSKAEIHRRLTEYAMKHLKEIF